MTYMSDKEQAQYLKDLWKKYASTIIVAILVFMAVNIGWHYWLQHSSQQKESASIIYSQMQEAQTQNKTEEFKLFAADLMQRFPHSAYASFAAMMLAKEATNAHDSAQAQKDLEWVIQHAKHDEIRDLARIRQARLFIEEKKPQAALDLLNKSQSKFYMAIKYEIMGDALAAQDKMSQAVDFYKKSIEINEAVQEVSSPLLRMKSLQ